jgi:hypothetical protein
MPDDVRLTVAQQLREVLELESGLLMTPWRERAIALRVAIEQTIADLEAGAAAESQPTSGGLASVSGRAEPVGPEQGEHRDTSAIHALQAWRDWFTAAKPQLDAMVVMSAIHGAQYHGPTCERALALTDAVLEAGAAAPVEGTRQPSDSTRSHLHE